LEETTGWATLGGMVATEIWPGQLANPLPSFTNQRVLILNQNSEPCAADKCNSLLPLLQRSLRVKCIQEQKGNLLPAELPFIPDLIVLRLIIGGAAEKLIESCKGRWNHAACLAIFCPNSKGAIEDFSPLLNRADDFISCPFHEPELLFRIRRILQSKQGGVFSSKAQELRESLRDLPLVGESPCFLSIIEKIPLLARFGPPLLISGETGSGKEVIARAIHYRSPRQGKPFIPVNCGALPDHLFENELFGHTKGAFTDASSAEKGLIAEAEGGTLFLDEIDALSQAGQVKLLRFLQNGEYRPVGSSRSAIADVRVITATNTDLMQLVKSRLFREDLYYRLNVLSLYILPLRERIEDIAPLTTYFLNHYAREYNQQTPQVSQDALQKLMTYSWPGNVRELEAVLRRAMVLNTCDLLQGADIDLPSSDREELSQAKSLRQVKTSKIQAFERGYLANILAAHQGNVTHAAKAAGKERRSFQRLLRKYNLDRHLFSAFLSSPLTLPNFLF
jgi:DNA-binding NtrC family response regulator